MRRNERSFHRRRVLKTIGAGGVVALAGCAGADDDAAEETPEPTPEEEETPESTPEDEDEDVDLLSTDAAPVGEPLSQEDIQALVEIFDDNPMNEDQREVEGANRSYTPRHVWKWVSGETAIGLHFDDPNPEEATALDYITIARKGLFTEESQPDREFTHFHQHTADSWEAGHGGSTGDEGYWLTHIAVREIQYPFHADPIDARVDYEFMPTPPEEGSKGHETDFETPDGGEGSLSDADRDALIELFDDTWTNDDQLEVDGQFTPAHVIKWVSEETFVFLHFNDPDPREATDLIYFGIGVNGQFDSESIPTGQNDDFTHFHKWEANGWEDGHGAQDAAQHGFWLVHHAVHPGLEMPWGEVEVGVDRNFMPTPVE